MGRVRPYRKPDEQFYTLFRDVGDYTTDTRVRGGLVSFGILGALIDFSTASGDPEERRFEEVKAAYAKLREIVNTSDQDPTVVLSQLTAGVEQAFDLYVGANPGEEDELEVVKSALLLGTFSRLKHRRSSARDRLLRDGSTLYDLVMNRGAFRGKKNFLNINYAQAKSVLVDGRNRW